MTVLRSYLPTGTGRLIWIPFLAVALCCALLPSHITAQAKPTPPANVQATAQQSSAAQLVAQMPAVAPSKPYHFPAVATKTLANGLRVFVVSSPETP